MSVRFFKARPGNQPKLLRGPIGLMGGQRGLGQSDPGAGKGLARGKPVRQRAQDLPGIVGTPGAELGDGQMRQGELGDIALWIGGQIPFQRPDGLGVSARLDVFLTEQEQGIGGDRAAR